jgi:hypothetical protein
LAAGLTSCAVQINGPANGRNESLIFRDGNGLMLGSGTASVDYNSGSLWLLVFGPVTALQVVPIDSSAVPGAYVITVADLSTAAGTYQVFVKNGDTGTTTQTSSISPSARTVGLPITLTGHYQVSVTGTSGTFTSTTFTIDATHTHDIVSFTDNSTSTGLVPNVIQGSYNCVG